MSINAWDGISFCTGSNTRYERMRITSDGNLILQADKWIFSSDSTRPRIHTHKLALIPCGIKAGILRRG